MADRDELIEIARQVLIGPSPLGREDLFILDHALRCLRYADVIVRFDEVRTLRVDRTCLDAAIMLHDVARVRLERERREWTGNYAAATMSQDDIYEASAEIAGDVLTRHLEPRQVEHTQDIIRQQHSRDAALAEVKILSDACNLDDLGAVGLWRDIRRYAAEGRGIDEALASWQRRQQYGYYQARLDETFRFKATRKWAARRLERLTQLMKTLADEHHATDTIID